MPSKTPVFIEFKDTSLHVLDGEHGTSFPIERSNYGKFTPATVELMRNGLRGFLSSHGGVDGRQAICAIPARGVMLRTITLPPPAATDPARFLTMQIEAQFPVAPTDLAWGYLRAPATPGDAKTGDEFIIAAIRRELLSDYKTLLESCGLLPLFCVAALARTQCVAAATRFSIVEVGSERSELLTIDERGIATLRVLNWGEANLHEPEKLRGQLPTNGDIYIHSSHGSVDILVATLRNTLPIQALTLTNSAAGATAATEGLRRSVRAGQQLLLLGAPAENVRRFATPAQWKWAATAIALLLAVSLLRYAEVALFNTRLSAKISEISAYRAQLPKLDRELSFLDFIKTNQPPYLDTVAVISGAAPSGTRFEQLSIARRGDVSLRGTMQDPQGPENFRSKLIASGFFSKVVVEEQVAIENPRKVNFRISADLKPEGARPALPPEPPKSTNQPASRPVPPRTGPPAPGAKS